MGIARNVLFVGYLDRQTQLPSCYAAADLFVFSSKTETQGLVLLEAMAMGLPTLGIPAMGAAEILGPERGAVCAPDDMIGFAERMCALLMDRPRLAVLSVEARKFAGEWAAPERARQLAELYQQLGRRTMTNK
jgi:glycosyltransferase involved in cell wall biosynthesis